MLINHMIDYMICDGDTGKLLSMCLWFETNVHSEVWVLEEFCSHIRVWFSPAIMLVHGRKEQKVFWEFDSIIMQNTSHNVLFFLRTNMAVSSHDWNHLYMCVSFFFSTGNAYQLSQLIRTLLDPENMALGANVRFSFLAKSRNFYYYSSLALSLLIYIPIVIVIVAVINNKQLSCKWALIWNVQEL